MTTPLVYDKARFHYEGEFPDGLSVEQAFVHTGLYLGWLIERDLCSAEFLENAGELIPQFRAREVTGPAIYQECDGALVDDMLSDEGNAFSRAYYDFETGRFLADYEQALARDLPSLYHVEDTWENYETLRSLLDSRFEAWRRSQAKRWWQFWK